MEQGNIAIGTCVDTSCLLFSGNEVLNIAAKVLMLLTQAFVLQCKECEHTVCLSLIESAAQFLDIRGFYTPLKEDCPLSGGVIPTWF